MRACMGHGFTMDMYDPGNVHRHIFVSKKLNLSDKNHQVFW